MNVLLVDAFDSFVHVVRQYLLTAGADTTVVRSNAPDIRPLADAADAIVLGPGPGHPAASGHVELVREFSGLRPILGICLGHQAICLAYGGSVRVAGHLMHGKTSVIRHDGAGVFAGRAGSFRAARYHSLIVDEVPRELAVTARAEDDGYVMGLRHLTLPVEGVQFHPESIRTEHGQDLITNFVVSVHRNAPAPHPR